MKAAAQKPQKQLYLVPELIFDTPTTKVKKFRFTVGEWNKDRAVAVYPEHPECYSWLLFDSVESADNYHKVVYNKINFKKSTQTM